METWTDNQDDEFEEVASPFSSILEPEKRKNPIRQKNTRRSLGPLSSEPPLVSEPIARSVNLTPIRYIDENDEEDEVRPVVARAKKSNKNFKLSFLQKFLWSIIVVLSLRLVFMERGVVDFFKMRSTLEGRRADLRLIRNENTEIKKEIQKILYDNQYQKNLAKEHLGVIAADEFLILFPSDSKENSI